MPRKKVVAATENEKKAQQPIENKETVDLMTPAKESSVFDEPKTYAPTDLILTRSITTGYVNFMGAKTRTTYSWVDVGDTTEVEYQDLRAALLSRSPYLFDPIIVIEDEELLSQPEWKTLDEFYKEHYSIDDLSQVMALDVSHMTKVLEELPVGARRSFANLAKTMMDRGTLDSIKKIEAIDKVLGTELMLYIK